ncbi:hypothetical protein [Nitrosovibrio sp. Nv4]|uniref:hypothetical protein n=1 Tax=Nitrosovibrio sp. Nv4 TaxID=1945880 RepID=UPI000BC90110|nr:hypothetical protein [Nitrosovibrio sp. Nv4]SOD40564.1 hypothetical protein SAMN06298226_0836 [Nitrosovibrio sp. Nv4]
MSASEIDFDKLNNDGLFYAGDQLLLAAQVLIGLLDSRELPEEIIRKHPTLVVGIALLAHLDERAEERRIMKEAELNTLGKIADAIANSKAGDNDK